MLDRKFFVTVLAIFLVSLISLPAYAALETETFGGTLDTVNSDPNPYGLTAGGGITWTVTYDDSIIGWQEVLSIDFLLLNTSHYFYNVAPNDDTFSTGIPWIEFDGTNVLALELNSLSFSETGQPTLSSEDVSDQFKLFGIDGFFGQGTLGFDPINEVPIPGAIWLLGSGLVGLVGLRRRFRKA